MKTKLYTLVFVRDGARILLGMKKRGFGEGRWNGFGGKVEPGETPRVAAARELHEEAGLEVTPDHLSHLGELTFTFVDDPVAMQVSVYSIRRFRGEPRESEEMRPRWFSQADLPFDEMWPDDRHWFPYLLSDRRFRGEFLFRGHDTILSQKLETVPAPQ